MNIKLILLLILTAAVFGCVNHNPPPMRYGTVEVEPVYDK